MLRSHFKKLIFFVLLLGLFALSCTKTELAKINTINTNIGNLTSAPPASLFLTATNNTQSSFEYFYDLNRFNFPLAQIFTNSLKGVANNTLTDGNTISNRYSVFLSASGVGNYLTDAEREFYSYYSPGQQAERSSWVPIFRILKAYYAFYVSDVYGSIAYTNAFKAKEGILKPTYDTQEALYDTLEAQLKNAVVTLKTLPGTVKLEAFDLYYNGVAIQWVKAANALRLKIAMRLMKRSPAKLASIANEVLNNNTELMANNIDSWRLRPGNSYFGGSGGNWDPLSVFAKGIKGTVDFMWNNVDPRIRLFYQKNNYSQDNINTAISAGIYPAGTIEPVRRYIGSYASFDAANSPANSRLQSKIIVNSTLTLDTLSTIQDRLISPSNKDANGVSGSGNGTFILISYADLCFMRAELAARGITTENAQTLYNAGIEASISMYDEIASLAQVYNYSAVQSSEISNYKTSADVVYNSSKALEQITTQAYINYFLQPNEAWALIKRTGYPNASTKLVYEIFMINGAVATYPRRATLNDPSLADDNYVNEKAALDGMKADPNFGNPGDNAGRVWWDVP
jgi:Starch-binding associating with outer membrane